MDKNEVLQLSKDVGIETGKIAAVAVITRVAQQAVNGKTIFGRKIVLFTAKK